MLRSPHLAVAKHYWTLPTGSTFTSWPARLPPCPPAHPTHSSDLLLAFGTAGCIAHIIAGGAKDSPLLLEEAALIQDLPTLAAHKLFRVVCVAQGYQVAAPAGRGDVCK